jgi:hypothetical protein
MIFSVYMKTLISAALILMIVNIFCPNYLFPTNKCLAKNTVQLPCDSTTLYNAIKAAQVLKNFVQADSLAGLYIKIVKYPFKPEDIDLLCYVIKSSKYAGFQWLVHNSKQINLSIKKEYFAEKLISYIIKIELIDSIIRSGKKKISQAYINKKVIKKYSRLPNSVWEFLKSNFENSIINYELYEKYTNYLKTPDWKFFEQDLSRRYREVDIHGLILKNKPTHYRKIKNWNACGQAMIDYLSSNKIDDVTCNDLIWKYVFLLADDQNVLRSALALSKKNIDRAPDEASYIDTYANLLYKLGDRKAALEWEELALKLERSKAYPFQISDFEETLNKMKNNIKTWQN